MLSLSDHMSKMINTNKTRYGVLPAHKMFLSQAKQRKNPLEIGSKKASDKVSADNIAPLCIVALETRVLYHSLIDSKIPLGFPQTALTYQQNLRIVNAVLSI